MSNIFDTQGDCMSFEEKMTWVSALVTALVVGIYVVSIGGEIGNTPVAEIAYQRPLLIAVGASVAMMVAGSVLMSIGTAIAAAAAGDRSVDHIDRKDERDVRIDRDGELLGHYVSTVGALGVLVLAMLRCDQFWIANALYLSFVAGSLAASVAKLIAYRRGV